VLAELAPGLVLTLLTTAPPHLAAVVALMLPTAPIEVFFFIVLLAAGLACFETAVELALPLDKFLDSQLGLFFIHCELLACLLEDYYLLHVAVVFLCYMAELLLKLHFSVL